ncbi:MAG: anthranilate phosphoribosyltransferase [Planctomycetota bacterium]|nr:MAG: anthranilate phosphoribosyltransferase [Planctomycetota bacterium]
MERRDLTESQAQAAAAAIVQGAATPAQIAALLVALRMKGETVAEITGFARAMRAAAVPTPIPCDDLVDTCGTGGDGAQTFNISTCAAIVAAAVGCHVAKHGNRAISSRCGSADVLCELGVNIDAPPEVAARCVEHAGVGFLFAPRLHPGMKHAAGPRRELAARSIFNLLGPLTNPAGARRQVVGVYNKEWTEPLAEVLGRLGAVHCLVVHGSDGLDEITTTGSTRVSELRDGGVRTYELHPHDVGLETAAAKDLVGGDAATNARIVRAVLSGEPGAARDVVALNAGAVAYVAGKAQSIAQGVALACEAMDSGAAARTLSELVRVSNEG